MLELVAPAGDYQKFLTALHFGADAVYLGGKDYNLRAFSENFTAAEMTRAVKVAHKAGKKVYVTLNAFLRNGDLQGIPRFLTEVHKAGPDAVIVSDIGVIQFVKEFAPGIAIHLSTQANVTNIFSALAYVKMGVKRIILARELSLREIGQIYDALPRHAELEAFVHGAMCISYSGRCLLSNYFTGRGANSGECAQPCRWEYNLTPAGREEGLSCKIQEDKRGAYILNSRDLNMLPHLYKLHYAGVRSFKIEGRAKSAYYLATVVNAYRRALDYYLNALSTVNTGQKGFRYTPDPALLEELKKVSHRGFTAGFYFEGDKEPAENTESGVPSQTYDFIAEVIGYDKTKGAALVEQRNKFSAGDIAEILSPDTNFNKTFVIEEITDENGAPVTAAAKVQERLYVKCPYTLSEKDILRRAKK